MSSVIKILIVEDEMVIGAKISMQLTGLGYEVAGLLSRGEDALLHIEKNRPDVLLLDIQLKGVLDGIQLAEALLAKYAIPVIYLTANSDEATFNRAKHTRPAAFISKPFKQLDLQRAIELVTSRMALDAATPLPAKHDEGEQAYILNDRIFVRCKGNMVKVLISDILFIEADRNYSRIYTCNRDYTIAMTLKIVEDRLPPNHFIRIHRSYIVNLLHIDEVAETHVRVAQKTIPISSSQKDGLLLRLQTL